MSKNLEITLFVAASPEKVFQDISNVSKWWIGQVEGSAEKVGAEFIYSYKEFHNTTQKVTEMIPSKKIVWNVTTSEINFVKNINEWFGTNIIFELVPVEGGTEIHFTHEGLTPAVECFGGCSEGWDFYINKSLKNYILNGEGIDPGF